MSQTLENMPLLSLLFALLMASPVVAQTVAPNSDTAGSKSDTAVSKSDTAASTKAAGVEPTALSFAMKSINGQPINLSKYAGNVVLFVNVASKCGRTPQYKQLQSLHEKYAKQGLSIVGVPCNQFGRQEPGSEAEIVEFCQRNYGVEFDMLAKVDVKGKTKCELYQYLTDLDLAPAGKGDVGWNFEKFIINRNGKAVARFGSKVKPDAKAVVNAIEESLAEPRN